MTASTRQEILSFSLTQNRRTLRSDGVGWVGGDRSRQSSFCGGALGRKEEEGDFELGDSQRKEKERRRTMSRGKSRMAAVGTVGKDRRGQSRRRGLP